MRHVPAALFLAMTAFAAGAQQMDMEAMQKWASKDLIRYHVVGVHQDAASVASDGSGLADISDRVVIDFSWKLSEATMVGEAAIQNFKSTASKLRDREPSCLPPVLKGDLEFYTLQSVRNGPGGALEFTIVTDYPVVEVAQFCTASRKSVPAKVTTWEDYFSVPSPVMMAMGIAETPELSLSADRQSFIVKKGGWIWTITPS